MSRIAPYKLSATRTKSLTKSGRYSNGGGLYLRIRPTEAKSWIFHYADGSWRRDLGLGGYQTVSLSLARKRAAACREAMADGLSPGSAVETKKAVTFGEAADAYIAMRSSDCRSQKTRYKWTMFLLRRDLMASHRSGMRCAAFVLLTAARNGEARYATWDQIDWEARTWTIPGDQMKQGRDHIAPLSSQAVRILKEQPRYP